MFRHRCARVALVLALTATLPLAALVSGCGGKPLTVKSGVLSMGSPTDVMPFEGMQGGKPTGFDVELAQAIATRLGLAYKFVDTHWNDLIKDLDAEKYDMVMAAVTITYDRLKTLEFSSPYFTTDQSIITTVESPIRSASDLAGKVVGVLNASTPQYAAEKIKIIKEIKKYNTVAEVYAALEAGHVDAMILDLSITRWRSRDGRTVVIAEIKTNEKYGIALKKGNTELKKKLNEALKQLKDDGTYDRIYKKWFGSK